MREDALAASRGLKPTPGNLEKIGGEFGVEVARWAFGQWEWRSRAKAKFAKAAEMLFDREALEMASHEEVAAFHASLFPPGVKVADLTCGIGADTIALARDHQAVGFEIDSDRADYARHNLSVHGAAALVLCGDSLGAPVDWEYAFADPARRTGEAGRGRRVSRDGSAYSPSVDSLLAHFQGLKGWIVKLSPLLSDSVLAGVSATQIYVSHQGECKEVLCTNLPLPGLREAGVWAYQIESGAWLGGALLASTEKGCGSVYEADPAAIRSHGLDALCAQLGLEHLGDSNGYLVGKSGMQSPWLKEFEVIADVGNDERRLKELIRDIGPKNLIVKQRGCDLDPEKVARKLHPKSSERGLALHVLAYPVGKSIRYVLARVK
ncbi:MAG: hypothetical protein ABL949_00880 [Fimbriimonadaceae bacterium]